MNAPAGAANTPLHQTAQSPLKKTRGNFAAGERDIRCHKFFGFKKSIMYIKP